MSSINTTWSTDSNTTASATSSTTQNVSLDGTLTVAGTLQAKEQVGMSWTIAGDLGTSESFINFGHYPLTVSSTPSLAGHAYTYPCTGVLRYIYYVANDWNPNDSSNTQSWKCYRYRPDGSTNTGDMDTLSNWSALETISKSTLSLAASQRGIFINFTDDTCTFNKGDVMAISLTNSVDVTDATADDVYGIAAIELDWNYPIRTNI